jgi:hypothetical protein
MGAIRLFVSHAHKDKLIATALVDVIEAALDTPHRAILCTSHDDPEYREPENVDVSKYLREHLSESGCVLGVLTPNSIKSPWCLFELGGAWAKVTQTYPLLAGGLSKESLPAALKGKDAAQLTEPEDIRRVLADISETLEWKMRSAGSATTRIDDLIEIVHECSWNSTLPSS